MFDKSNKNSIRDSRVSIQDSCAYISLQGYCYPIFNPIFEIKNIDQACTAPARGWNIGPRRNRVTARPSSSWQERNRNENPMRTQRATLVSADRKKNARHRKGWQKGAKSEKSRKALLTGLGLEAAARFKSFFRFPMRKTPSIAFFDFFRFSIFAKNSRLVYFIVISIVLQNTQPFS